MIFWLRQESNVRTEEKLREDAIAVLKGCREHFRKGVTRVSKISAIVHPSQSSDFQGQAHALLDLEDTEKFLNAAHVFMETYPKVIPWLSWWMRPAHASMLFTSERSMAPAIWDSIPDTTNAEEAMHWKLYAAIGKHQSFFQGMEGLFKFTEYFNRIMAAKLGEYMGYL